MRREPSSATAQREAARRHRARAYEERNELLRLLTRLWPSHLMPVSANLAALDGRRTLCIHSPAGQLAYVLSAPEAVSFAYLREDATSHYDGCTWKKRSERLSKLPA